MIKVFQMNDCDWVAAHTIEEARAWYLNLCGGDSDDVDDYIDEGGRELSPEEIDTMKVNNEGEGPGGVVTMREILDGYSDDELPAIICSTES